ncbi:hypothetical protein EJ110_NYTH16977 [Nymphaea thermarum]|nr:hypothetical protein EJ110_NYTH16977 [Nymphaea thermarum]
MNESPRARKAAAIVSSAGEVRRQVLSADGRTKLNPRPDKEFYDYPRLVKHVDDGFMASLTETYRERVEGEGAEVLDLMSSWVSHLPAEIRYRRVVGHGLNAGELARNPRLDRFFVQDLNVDHRLPLGSATFDAVLCAVSVQYLQQPEQVFAEVFRVLKPGGVFIVSFSNRMFYDKAISAWRDTSDYGRIQLVVQYFQCVSGFTEPEVVRGMPRKQDDLSPLTWIKRLIGKLNSDPFYAVISYKNFRPIKD